jgi:cytidine deaminase
VIIIVFYEPFKYSTHAEKDAIRKVKNKSLLKYCKIHIIKIKGDQITNATPCEMCCNLLKKYNLNQAS